MTERNRPESGGDGLVEGLATERLVQEAKSLLEAFAQKAISSIGDKVTETAHGLIESLENRDDNSPGVKAAVSGIKAVSEGKSPVKAALGAGATGLKEKVKQAFGGGKGGKKALKFTTIIETIDVGVPLRLAYDQWTQFKDFPSFMKKVEQADPRDDDTKAIASWKAQVFWSHRTWESTVEEQVPDDHIVWRSKGAKGHVDGAISFSELAPNLTRICLVLEYHPQGLFERTGNIWRAQGRRARLEFKHFRRHAMAHAILNPDEIEGWRGEVREGEIVKTHEEAMEEEKRAREEEEQGREDEKPRDEETAEDEEPETQPVAGRNGQEGNGAKRARRPSGGTTNGTKPSAKEANGTGTTRVRRRPESRNGERSERPARTPRRPETGNGEKPVRRRPKARGDEEEPPKSPRTRRRPAADGSQERPRRRRPTRRDEGEEKSE